ncbi:hypothetical protein ES703_91331 [subsurface metagenome]
MMFGEDFFKIIQFAMAVLRLFARIFGDAEDRKNDDKCEQNHRHEVDKIIPPPKPKP